MAYAKLFSVGRGLGETAHPSRPHTSFRNGDLLCDGHLVISKGVSSALSYWSSGADPLSESDRNELLEAMAARKSGQGEPFQSYLAKTDNNVNTCMVVLPADWRQRVADQQAQAANTAPKRLDRIAIGAVALLVLGGIGYGIYRIVR